MFYAFQLFLFGSHIIICEWFMQGSGNILENFKECPVLQKGVPKH